MQKENDWLALPLVLISGWMIRKKRTCQTSARAPNQGSSRQKNNCWTFYSHSFPAPFGSGGCFVQLLPQAESGQKGIRPCVHLQKAAPSAAVPQQPVVVVLPSKHRGMIREKRNK